MKKSMYDGKDEIGDKFNDDFDVCHHCKYLYPLDRLEECKYSSVKTGVPSLPSSHFATEGKNLSSQRFSTRRRNCLFGYKKKGTLCFM